MAMMRLRREDPRVVGSFRLHRRLGAGGMGVVYLGSDRRGQRVALKVIRPDLAEDREFRSRFAREVSAARRIRGGCTARLVAADLEADRPWFATQYVPGPSLHDKVNEEGPLPAAQVASIGSALAEGLLAVHEAGVVHRDLKPSNILLSPKGPRIIDFGIAWATGASTLTHVGTAVGSPGFLAPEQVRGAAVTPATDVFALGATLAYASTADSPFGHGSSEVMLYRVVHEEPQLLGVPDALAPLLHACLAKDPEDRPSTLQLSLRLKEIAAREAHGHGSGAGGYGGGQGRPPARRPEAYADQHTERRSGGTPAPRSGPPSPRPGASTGGGSGRPSGRNTPARPAQRRGGPRPPARTGRPAQTVRTSPNGRRPSGPNRLLRQRLTVFVVVTLLVALGIAAAQGCQGPANGLGGAPPRPTESVSSAAPGSVANPVEDPPEDSLAAEPDGRQGASGGS
ncbi:serine/threonine-protein kinase [Streptomyces rapamycinicus]|uniref:Protein kinase n=2 Tax=Streptomyces rapamycinicus TaxID=1226757 RepID=A0A0A0N4N4_STRRN|nr:serine/threonine-protein kinase [Streptomyces rapamycinicus]AGP53722.1 nuclease PIN [Streptomyces rapamycinicus NRRL 5491]MBB4781210.1 serine/threonine protein kinase [Streptomyces rapamycinicus]RLV74145.1 protein kinase [Streptomyces rapamycinicus NRRL 5491]UTO61852.1 serine/threonine protein kinase [Streptomyces rapamycinicus]UTP29804.1 serine/threonine protein kinase [Streptomyces rapamycinicus NRRL 5491]